MLSNLRIVLVNPSHPGNIGAAARAMKNMGVERLCLVEPTRYPSAEATARASGADDVLAAARVCGSLDEALVGCGLVFGASARLRSLRWPGLDARGCAEMLVGEGRGAPAAVVFGRENSGLTNTELERCHYLVHIPCNPAFSSLNVAAAVQIIVYEIFMAATGEKQVETDDFDLATAEEMDALYGHMAQTLVDIEFLDPQRPRQLMRRLRRLFNRARLDKTELNILRGILSAAQKRHPR